MKTTALASNSGLLLVLSGYFLTLPEISFNSLELLLLVFAFTSSLASIIFLLPNRSSKWAYRLGIAIAATALLTTLAVYVVAHQPLKSLDLPTDWPVLLVLAGMLIAPASSLVAVIVLRPGNKTMCTVTIKIPQ